MKTLKESLFDNDLSEKNFLDNPEFKKWINRPDILWYLYEYWAADMEDPLEDFSPNEWNMYKDIVDYILNKINQKSGNMWSMYKISYDAAEYFDEIKEAFGGEDEFMDEFDAVVYEIKHKRTQEYDGVWKMWFKGSMPKNSNITSFVSKLPDEGSRLAKPGALAGGILLSTDSDSIMIWGFPRGLDKDILNLFNIK